MSVLIVVTFGLIVVGFTMGESGKTAKKENISICSSISNVQTIRNARRTKRNMKKKIIIFF